MEVSGKHENSPQVSQVSENKGGPEFGTKQERGDQVRRGVVHDRQQLAQEGHDVTIWFCPHFIFYFPLPLCHMTSLSPDRSPDLRHLTGRSPDLLSYDLPYCSHRLLSYSLLSAIYGNLIVLRLLSYLPLFPLLIVSIPIVPESLLFAQLGHLVMVAASVVYKPSLYHRRGLKPDLVF